MGKIIGQVLGALLRNLFVSIVMFIIVFSVTTGEFPPKLERLKKTYESLQQMAQLSSQIHDQQKFVKNQEEAQADAEKDVEALQELNLKRAKLGVSLLQGNGSSTDTIEVKDLKERLKELEVQLYRLQQRVNQLEDRKI